MRASLDCLFCNVFMRSLGAGAFAVRVSTLAHNFGLVCDAFAMGTAVFRFVRGNATASSVGAFLRSVGHNPLLVLCPPEAAEQF